MANRHPLTMRLPLLEMGPSGTTLSTVRKRYEAHRSTGLSVQQATRETEKELGISDVRTSPDGKDVVYFKEETDLELVNRIFGVNLSKCPVCGHLLAHRGGQALPCFNPKCPVKGQPVSEGRREEDENEWIASHPGFEYGVYDGDKLLSHHPSVPRARKAAKKAIGPGTDIRVKDMHDKSRVYFHESAYPGSSPDEIELLKILQSEFPGVKHIYEAYPKIDFENLKFEIGVSKRMKFPDVTVKVKGGPGFGLPLELAQLLLRGKQGEIRSVRKFVQSRW